MSAVDLETVHLSVAAILQTIHRAVRKKNYNGEFRIDSAEITSFVMLLPEHIRIAVLSASLLRAHSDVDWYALILEPVVTSFDLEGSPDVSLADHEYIILLATVITMAYEILLLPGAKENVTTTAFLATPFERFLCEPEVYGRIFKLGR
jgi:hypothetical protein